MRKTTMQCVLIFEIEMATESCLARTNAIFYNQAREIYSVSIVAITYIILFVMLVPESLTNSL